MEYGYSRLQYVNKGLQPLRALRSTMCRQLTVGRCSLFCTIDDSEFNTLVDLFMLYIRV